MHFAKRFPLQQSEKVRLIDDFSVCGVNSTYSLPEKLRVHCVDILTAFVATLMDRPDLPDGFRLAGRTFDLKSAYKQYAVDVFHADFLKVAVKKPGSSYGVFDVLALPFGATGSVSGFLRISAAIHFIGLHMGVLWTSFFDDFTAICPLEDQEGVAYAVNCLFKMLGIDFASEGKKAPHFSGLFNTLGLQLDVRRLSDGLFTVGHTEKRINELVKALSDYSGRDMVTPKDLEKLHGRLVWFNSYIFGRKLNRAVFEGDLKLALDHIFEYVGEAEPASISRCVGQTWFLFSDGAYEPFNAHAASIGAVLVDPCGRVCSFFGEALDDECRDIFTKSSCHPIYELETLALLWR